MFNTREWRIKLNSIQMQCTEVRHSNLQMSIACGREGSEKNDVICLIKQIKTQIITQLLNESWLEGFAVFQFKRRTLAFKSIKLSLQLRVMCLFFSMLVYSSLPLIMFVFLYALPRFWHTIEISNFSFPKLSLLCLHTNILDHQDNLFHTRDNAF